MATKMSLTAVEVPNSVSTPNNTSNITVTLSVITTGTSNNMSGDTKGSITINGTSYSLDGAKFPALSTTVIFTRTLTIAHNTDGSKTVPISYSFDTKISAGVLTGSTNLTLTTIPQMSVSLIASEVAGSASIATNKSNLYVKLTLTTNAGASGGGSSTGSITINGTQYSLAGKTFEASKSTVIYEASIPITHNSDGTKTVSVSYTYNPKITYLDKQYTGSANVTMTKIARASTLEVPTFEILQTGYIYVNRPDESLTHTVKLVFGTYSETLCTMVKTETLEWTPDLSLYNLMVGVPSKTGTISIDTFSGATKVGSNSYTFTVRGIDDAIYYRPSLFGLTIQRGRGTTIDDWVEDDNGAIVKISFSTTSSDIQDVVTNLIGYTDDIDDPFINELDIPSESTDWAALVEVNQDLSAPITIVVSDTVGGSDSYSSTVGTSSVTMNVNVETYSVGFGKVAEHENSIEYAEGLSIWAGPNLSDYIIEQGTSGNWMYRKWNSGVAECWGAFTLRTVINTAWGSVFTSDPTPQYEYPLIFADVPIEFLNVTSPTWTTGYYCRYAQQNTSSKTGGYLLERANRAETAGDFRMCFHVIGRWK